MEGVVHEIELGGRVPLDSKCTLELSTCLQWEPDMRNRGVNVSYYAVRKEGVRAASDRFDAHKKISRYIGTKCETELVVDEAVGVIASKRQATKRLLRGPGCSSCVRPRRACNLASISERGQDARFRVIEVGKIYASTCHPKHARVRLLRGESGNHLVVQGRAS